MRSKEKFLWKMLFVLGLAIFVGVGSWILNIHFSQVQASALPTPLPANCESAEIIALREMLSHSSEGEARQVLQQKLHMSEQEAKTCAESILRSVPAKPAPDQARPPEFTSLPTSTPWIGIHEATNPPSGISVTNMWTGNVNGNLVEIYAGAVTDDAWQEHPNQLAESAVFVFVNGKEKGMVSTTVRSGALQIVTDCGRQLVLQSQTGDMFVFDISTLTFVFGTTCTK